MTVPANEPGNGGSEVIDQGFGMMNGGEPNSTQPTQQPSQGQQDELKLNPAWEGLLGKLPEGLHGLVTPDLRQWDQNYQRDIQQVHSQYEGFKPFLDQKITPEALNQALLIQQALESNPEDFVKTVAEYYNLQLGGQGQPDPQQEPAGDDGEGLPFDISQDPRFQQYQKATELMAEQMIQQAKLQEEAELDAQVEKEFKAAIEKHGEFNEDLVIQRMMATGEDVETAVVAINGMIQAEIAKHRNPGANAPVMMGSGGGLPSQAVPVSNLSPQDRRSLVAQRLQAAQQASGG